MRGGTTPAWQALLMSFVLAGCSQLGSSGTAPDDMSAEDHREHSDAHARRAGKHEALHDPEASVEPDPGRPAASDRWGADYDYRYSGDYYWGGRVYNPTARHRAHAEKHQAHAREHLDAARVLEGFEEAQCASFPSETRAVCPLIGQLVSVEDIPGGSRVRVADGVEVNALVAHIRCHLAFARARKREGMDTCPLYLEGVRVSRVGPGPEVDFLIEGTSELEQLRETMRAHVAP